MSSDRQCSGDESPSISSGSSNADQWDPATLEPKDEENLPCNEEKHQAL